MRAPPGRTPHLVVDPDDLADQFAGIDAIDFAERQKFDDIDPALAALEAGNECLGFAQLACKFRLPNAGADASIDQCFYQLGVALGSYRIHSLPNIRKTILCQFR